MKSSFLMKSSVPKSVINSQDINCLLFHLYKNSSFKKLEIFAVTN